MLEHLGRVQFWWERAVRRITETIFRVCLHENRNRGIMLLTVRWYKKIRNWKKSLFQFSGLYQQSFHNGWFSSWFSNRLDDTDCSFILARIAHLWSLQFCLFASFDPFGDLMEREDSFVRFLLWQMSERANVCDESEDLHDWKMSPAREIPVICSEPEHNRDVACAWYAVNYSKHRGEVGTSFKRSFWWACFFFFFSVLWQIYF